MPTLKQLQQSFALALKPSQFVGWIDAISALVDSISAIGVQAQTRYVDKGGSDITGNGSFAAPFLTIQAAENSITDATPAKPYAIIVAPGVYTETFFCKPSVTIRGTSRTSTILSPVQANWIGGEWTGAIAGSTAIVNVTLTTNVTVNFVTVGNTAAAVFRIEACIYQPGVIFSATGNAAANVFALDSTQRSIASFPSIVHTFTNISLQLASFTLYDDSITCTSTGLYFYNNEIFNTAIGQGVLTLNHSGSLANPMFTQINGPDSRPVTGVVIAGDGNIILGPTLLRSISGPLVSTTFDFNTLTVGATKLHQVGFSDIVTTPTSDIVYTFNNPAETTRVRIKNASPTFFISLAGAALGTGNQGNSYVPPNGVVDMIFRAGTGWFTQTLPQFFTTTLVAGVSPVIPADITAQSIIVATLKTPSGAGGNPQATTRVVGTRAGGGSFRLQAVALATGAVVATDLGTYDVIVMRP